MKLTLESIKTQGSTWREKGFITPDFDIDAMRLATKKAPEWIHIGAGNIFRGYIARLADELIRNGQMESGIIAAECFSREPLERMYDPYDDLVLLVGLRASGDKYLRIIGSIAEAEAAVGSGFERLKEAARSDSLKMISFTITEKGYAYTDANGNVLENAEKDIANGTQGDLNTAMGKTASLLFERFKAGAKPIAVVSMDNCSKNGEKLRDGVMFIVNGWNKNGFVPDEFVSYVSDPSKVSFPWSMIDKITPRPDVQVGKALADLGIEGMEPVKTAIGTFIAPYVNAEMPEYLVIEDSFPNGRPPLEKAGVYFTDRETVNNVERMKVMTCLNPLHTALAVYGCLLGYTKIADEMNDESLRKLVYALGYDEGLPVVTDPVIIRPEDFLKEVLEERLPNPSLPDTPQRIATDTSQKIPIRFGETIKAYIANGDTQKLKLIPLVLAAWLRYLTGTDDSGAEMEISSDPQLPYLTAIVKKEWFTVHHGIPANEKAALEGLLKNASIFGCDLVSASLSDTVITYLDRMLSKTGAVRETLDSAVQ
ncbi:MAG: mannitol dehydrogenase family protein [Oscillospiraceae bacterium]|nr:mannitol dehydrogenase family protein [Oscillospiraceae bacterium]